MSATKVTQILNKSFFSIQYKMSTKKLFWENPYLIKCKANVTEIDGRKVKLDKTIFYAFSGGQESDEGTINDIEVVNAIKKGDKESILEIEYELEEEPKFKVGDIVTVRINGVGREKLRRLHTAAHIVYYFIIEKIGKVKIIGSNISQEKARIDFLYNQPLNKLLPEIEIKANEYFKEAHSIDMSEDPEKPELRWWSCEGWSMPCGGTHVKSTEEIGKIILKRKNIGAGKERVELYLDNPMEE